MALGQFANILIERHLAAREQRALSTPISEDEFEFAQQLLSNDGKIDLSVSPIFNTEGEIISKLYRALAILLDKDRAAAHTAMFTRAANTLALNPNNLCAKTILDPKVQSWLATLRYCSSNPT